MGALDPAAVADDRIPDLRKGPDHAVLAGPISVLELEQGRPELAPAEAVDARVDLADATFFLGGVLLLHDLAKEPVAAADDAAIAGRVPEGCGQDRDGGARLPVGFEQ